MKTLILCCFLLFSVSLAYTQHNLVANGSFERLNVARGNWATAADEFNQGMKHWKSGSLGSPDIFIDKFLGRYSKRGSIDIQAHQPRTGRIMAGIKTYGYSIGTTNTKEYLQIKLRKPMLMGEKYYVEFWVNPAKGAMTSNKIGAAFLDTITSQMRGTYKTLDYMASVELDIEQAIDALPNQWIKVSGTVEPYSDCNYLVIGCFWDDDAVEFGNEDCGTSYAYYFVDDVRVCAYKYKDDFSNMDLAIGQEVALDNIYFDSNKSILKDASFDELNKLVGLLDKKATMKISIQGHTDNVGNDQSNLTLSTNRAKAVYEYLLEKGIAQNQLSYEGLGEQKPIASNTTDEGREQNRRVAFKVLALDVK
ncbi:MAG: OmpA family protein [Aureispira sp.]|nr:OmpA family protein [Aureispira sp.]